MKVLIVGGGGREHAIAWKLAQSPLVTELWCAPGNGGIAQLATCAPVKATDIPGMLELVRRERFDFVVVAPDDPLALGMVDALEREGIPAFGPNAAAARIEGSKVFAKDLMRKYHIPTAAYEVFSEPEAALAYVATCPIPTVVKADGLALGKGVYVCMTRQEAEDAVKSIMVNRAFGESGARIVIEEYLTGPEVSVLAFCDGKTLVPMVPSQDHKRALDGDRGLNTGGMGTFSPTRHYTPQIAERALREIMLPTVQAMAAEGCPFKGVLFFGLMLTADGPKALEYNARFGDPETQVVLPRLKGDLMEIFRAVVEERLDQVEIAWDERAAACVVLASGGYPGSYRTGLPIEGLDKVRDALVFHAGTKAEDGRILTAGGRVLGVTALGDTLDAAIANAYRAVEDIRFEGMHYRRDIGKK